jgi:hypothetical protein
MENILLSKNVDVSKLTYGTVRSLENGGKTVYVGVEGKPLYLQTPTMITQWGLSKWNADKSDKDTAATKYSIDLSLKNMDTKPAVKHFYDLLSGLDKKFVEDGVTNSMSWFKKKYSATNVVEAIYTPMVKYARDKETGEITDKYPPSFRLNIPFRDGKIACDVFDDSKNAISISNIEKGSSVTAILQFTGLWLAGGKFGTSWKVVQLRVVAPATIKGFAFRETDEDNAKEENIEDIDDELAAPPPLSDDEAHDAAHEDAQHEAETEEQPAPKTDEQDLIESSDDDEIEKPKRVVKTVAKKTAKK